MKRPELSLEGKIALVTGASGGIGEAIAKVFGAAGARVFLHGTRREKLEALAAELGGQGVEVGWEAVDITYSDAPGRLVEAVISRMGGIDILVNSAGINRPQSPEEVTEKNWDDVLDINLKATFFVSQAAGREMIRRGGGKIINISSQAGIVALPFRSAYCSSKGGVNQLTRTLALEWAKYKINQCECRGAHLCADTLDQGHVQGRGVQALRPRKHPAWPDGHSRRDCLCHAVPGLQPGGHDHGSYPDRGWRLDNQMRREPYTSGSIRVLPLAKATGGSGGAHMGLPDHRAGPLASPGFVSAGGTSDRSTSGRVGGWGALPRDYVTLSPPAGALPRPLIRGGAHLPGPLPVKGGEIS